MERGPTRLAARVVADLAGEGVDLGVEAVEVVQRDRLEGHRYLGAAELVGAVMADDHVLESKEQLARERLAGQVGGAIDLGAEQLDAHDQVADELALVG